MLSLDDPCWPTLRNAYGESSGIPKLLREAEYLPEDVGSNAEPYFSLWSALCHQGSVYTASYAALPHLVRIVEENPAKFRWTLLALVHSIEAGRTSEEAPQIPDDLVEAYQLALARIPSIASSLLNGNLSELEIRVVLAACATAKGFSLLGDAITELTPEIAKRLLDGGIFAD
jgi:hypothetical protein